MEESSFSARREDSLVLSLGRSGRVLRLFICWFALGMLVTVARDVRAEKVQKLSNKVEESFQVQL